MATINTVIKRYNGTSWDELRPYPQTHDHVIADVIGLQDALDNAGGDVTLSDILAGTLQTDMKVASGKYIETLNHYARFNRSNTSPAMYVNQYGTGDIARFFKGTASQQTGGSAQVIITNAAEVQIDGGIKVYKGKDIVLQAGSGDDSGDIIFRDSGGVEVQRLWQSGKKLYTRSNDGASGSYMIYSEANKPSFGDVNSGYFSYSRTNRDSDNEIPGAFNIWSKRHPYGTSHILGFGGSSAAIIAGENTTANKERYHNDNEDMYLVAGRYAILESNAEGTSYKQAILDNAGNFDVKNGELREQGDRVFSPNHLPTWSEVSGKPSWIGSSKPSYSFSEITSRSKRTPYDAKSLGSSDNLNNITEAGFYYQTGNVNCAGNNYPVENAGSLLVQKSAGVCTQMYITYSPSSNRVFVRSYYNSIWGSWKELSISTHNHSSLNNQDSHLTFNADHGRGVRFWGSDSYKLYMSSQGDSEGGRLDTTSDYNMYFKMGGGTNRGFVFKNGGTAKAQIDGAGDLYLAGAKVELLNTTLTSSATDKSLKVSNDYGYIDIAPKNSSYCHIYTDRNEFYFNKNLKVNGNTVYPIKTQTTTSEGTVSSWLRDSKTLGIRSTDGYTALSIYQSGCTVYVQYNSGSGIYSTTTKTWRRWYY